MPQYQATPEFLASMDVAIEAMRARNTPVIDLSPDEVHSLHVHIWRYDAATPAEEQPWIVTMIVDGDVILDPPCFATYTEAVAFLLQHGPETWATDELAERRVAVGVGA